MPSLKLKKKPTPVTASKNFALADILSLVVGLCFSKENGTVATHRLVGFILEADASAESFVTHAADAKQCVEEQLPFLKQIDLAQLYMFYKANPEQADSYLNIWLEMQEIKYGATHTLMPLSLWKTQQGQAQPLSILSDKVDMFAI
jgi:hypothetical protein